MSFDAMRAAAEAGDARAQTTLGYCYAVGRGVPQDLTVAVLWYRKAAEGGYAPAQFNLAEMLRDGAGVEQSPQQAFEWYSKAAKQGHSKAQYNIAMMYVQGEGVAADNVMAYVWLMLARGGDAEGVEQALEIVAKGIGDRIEEGDRILADLRSQVTRTQW